MLVLIDAIYVWARLRSPPLRCVIKKCEQERVQSKCLNVGQWLWNVFHQQSSRVYHQCRFDGWGHCIIAPQFHIITAIVNINLQEMSSSWTAAALERIKCKTMSIFICLLCILMSHLHIFESLLSDDPENWLVKNRDKLLSNFLPVLGGRQTWNWFFRACSHHRHPISQFLSGTPRARSDDYVSQ